MLKAIHEEIENKIKRKRKRKIKKNKKNESSYISYFDKP
jgi:hypothetical protein